MNKGITKENLLFIVPPTLTRDPSVAALADAAAEALAARAEEADRARVVSNIDELPEALLDILAYDFKVDWWDPNYTLDEKRRTLKSSWRVHKRLGTKAAVDEAISAIFPRSSAEPWFQYGGEPYHFRLEINTSENAASLEKQARVLELARYYQSLRDHLDGLRYTIEARDPAVLGLGGAMGAAVCFPIPEAEDSFDFQGTARLGAGVGIAVSVPVQEKQEDIEFRFDSQIGGIHSTISTMPIERREE